MLNIKSGLIVCNDLIKNYLLELIDKENQICDYSFITYNELKKKLFFDYKKKAVYFLCMEYNLKVETALSYLNSLYYINDDLNIKDEKIDFLKEIKKYLEDNELLIDNSMFLNILKRKNITFIAQEKTSEFLMIIDCLKEYTSVETIDIFNEEYEHNIYSFNTISQEVNYVFNEIKKLVQNNVCLSKIKLCNVSSDYLFIINRVSRSYNLKVDYKTNGGLLESGIYLSFINKLKEYDSFLEGIKGLSNYDSFIINKVIKIINDYEAFDISPKLFSNVLEYEIQKIDFEYDIYENILEIIDFNDAFYDDSYHLFFLGFNSDVPYIYKDEDYLPDNLKEKLRMNTSLIKNVEIKNAFIKRFKHHKNLIVTFAKNLTFGETIVSSLVNTYSLNLIKVEDSIYLNETETNLDLGMMLDNYYLFNEENTLLKEYHYNNYQYKKYDNTYNVIEKSVYDKYKKEVVKLSYSALKDYYSCSFSYYVNRVLKIDGFSSTLASRLGTFAHEIFKDSYNDDFDFEESKEKNIVTALNAKEVFYYEVMSLVVYESIMFNKEFEEYSMLQNTLCEEQIDIYYDDNQLLFTGIIDKVKYAKIDDEIVCAIIDYKTGKDVSTLKHVEHGLNLQLIVYLYLLNKSGILPNPKVIGFYLQRINPMVYKRDLKQDTRIQLASNLKLDGYSLNDTKYLEIFNAKYDEGYLKGVRLKKDGTFYSNSKVITEEKIAQLSNLVEELILKAYEGIKDADFSINPKRINFVDYSCVYCSYSDICYKKTNDYINLEDDDEEGDVDGN